MTIDEIAPTEGLRNGIRVTQAAMIKGSTRLAVLIVLFLSSLMYVIRGGTFALDALPVLEPETSITTAAINPVDVGRNPRRE